MTHSPDEIPITQQLVELRAQVAAAEDARQRAEEALHQSEQRLNRVLSAHRAEADERQRTEHRLRFAQFSMDRSADAIFWIAGDAHFLYVNERACQSLGYGCDELLTKTVFDLDPNFRPENWPEHWQEIQERGSFVFESLHSRKDGSVFPVEITVNYLEFEGQAYNCALARDITARKKAEEAYRSLIEQSLQGFALIQHGRIIFGNQAFADMSGYSVNELLNMSWEEYLAIIYPDDHDIVSRWYQACILGQPGSERLEFRMIRRNGSVWWLEISAVPVEYQGQAAIQATFIDITGRKQAGETQRQAHERLRELDRMKDEFIASVSHELRTPITSLKLYHHLMSRNPSQTTTYIERLTHTTARMEAIVEELLFVAQMKDSVKRPVRYPINLNTQLEILIAERQPLAADHQQTLILQTMPNLPLISADPILVERLVDILLTNALSYTRPGGHIEIQTLTATLYNQQCVGLRVSNNGPSIPPDERPYLFERFFRGYIALETGTPGAGLGLAIARQIVEQHHGKIVLEDPPLEGFTTSFIVWLPLRPNEET